MNDSARAQHKNQFLSSAQFFLLPPGEHFTTSKRIVMAQHHLPLLEMPRERLLAHGATALSISELLAVIIGSGTRGNSVFAIVEKLITRFKDMRGLQQAQIVEIMEIPGVSLAICCRIKACIELAMRLQRPESHTYRRRFLTSQSLYAQFGMQLQSLSQEAFLVIAFNAKNQFLAERIVAVGAIDTCSVSPREVLSFLISAGAVAAVFMHNHPSSGDPAPSAEDKQLTQLLQQLCALLRIKVLDHLVIGERGYISFHDSGLLHAVAQEERKGC